ncbi:metallophosphoesterase [Mucilaginibacter galii]|uniref:Phosphoesterase n=1 Tax=Mucilaginibacter galii TaxID=2005073 RepID=A0A917J4M0_9SPHI|nr:metallophosphoesterase [Mucilaginibacter galii]GGI48953.1 phosphoesterase [Mucilaginibacter galii]
MRHGILQFTLILAGISLLLDLYVHQGLRSLMPRLAKNTRRIVLASYWIISIGVTLLLMLSLKSSSKPPGMTTYHQWLLSIFITLLITKVFFVLVLFAGDIYRLVAGLINAGRKTPVNGKRYVPARRRFVSETAVLVAAIPFTSFLYAMFKGKYDYKVHRHTLYFDDLPEAFDGFTITQISDVHSGSFDNAEAVQRGIDLAKAQKSDLFVFTGDLVNNVASEIEPYIGHFSQLKAPYGQFSVLGNHDYGDYVQWRSDADKAANLEKLKAHHKTLGYKLLLDENVRLEKDGQKIVLIGVQNWGRGFIQIGDLDRAMQGVAPDEFKILLSHDPTHWEEKVRHHPSLVHLTLSGHTHGAQFGVETDKFRWSPVKYRYLDWAGLLVENKRQLYVNRGFGFLAFSGRLGIWPEITVIELKRRS